MSTPAQRIAVAGGTGVVGRHVVAALAARGAEPVVLSRAAGVDLVTGQGLDAALEGVGAVVDASGTRTQRRATAVAFFTTVTRHLLAAGQRAGVRHHVALSIIGIDRVESGYYAGKQAQEQAVLSGPLPATVLHTTQFHEFAAQVLALVPGPVAPVPVLRVQPVAAREVAAALADLALAPAPSAPAHAPSSPGRRCTSCPTSPGGCCGPVGSAGSCCRCVCRVPPRAPPPAVRCSRPRQDRAAARRSRPGWPARTRRRCRPARTRDGPARVSRDRHGEGPEAISCTPDPHGAT